MAKTTKSRTVKKVKKVQAPSSDEIARRAYEIFLLRGGEHGHDLEDWLQAESQLLNERTASRPTRGD